MDTNNDTSEQSSESESSCKHLMYKTVGGYSEPDSGFKVCILPLQSPKEVRDKVQVQVAATQSPFCGHFYPSAVFLWHNSADARNIRNI